MNKRTKKLRSEKKAKNAPIEMIDLDRPGEVDDLPSSTRKTSTNGGSGRFFTKPVSGGKNLPYSITAYAFFALFVILILYFVFFQAVKSESVIASPYNSRLDLYAEHVVRGDILSSDGKVLATTEVDRKGNEYRVYPYKRMFAHAVGYMSNGKAGIESQYNFYMLRSHASFPRQVINELKNKKNPGDRVVTTLDYDVQEAAYDALGSYRGAVIVLEPDTGKIIAMVSKPAYNPNTVGQNWDEIISDDDSSLLLNRATQGLYPPGSTFKVLTTLEYIHEHSHFKRFSYDCDGEVTVGKDTIHCYGNAKHGREDLADAFANSCNTAYASIGLDLSVTQFHSLAKKMLFNRNLPTNLQNTAKSSFTLSGKAGSGLVMQTAIGQGDTMVSPLHMAMIAAAVDADGTVYKPYIVDHIENNSGDVVKRYDADAYGKIMSSEDAKQMQKLMRAVVKHGTASRLKGKSYTAAGKTGSAEYNSRGDSHGWYIGYASKDGKKDVAIAVIAEGGGSGSGSAVPIAARVLDAYFD